VIKLKKRGALHLLQITSVFACILKPFAFFILCTLPAGHG